LTFLETLPFVVVNFCEWRVALFFKTEMDNPASNPTCNKRKCIWCSQTIMHIFGNDFQNPNAFSLGRSVHGRILHKNAGMWVSVDRYALHCVACEV
jgi:hypothetical protein